MRRPALYRAARCGASSCIAVAAIAGATYLRGVNHTTVALGVVLVTLWLATRWGWQEALSASLAAGIAFDYYFLPPRGFSLEAPEHGVTLVAFLLTAITTGGLAARANRHRNEAEQHSAEMARLYELGSALRDSEHMDTVQELIASYVVDIFGVQDAAFFDRSSARIFRSGPGANRIPDDRLREAASSGTLVQDRESGVTVVPVRESGNLAGSLGITGPALSQRLLDAIAERVGVAIAKTHAARQSMEAEVARRSENLKSAVLDALAHEIRGPLATVKVSVDTLLSQALNAAQQHELLAIIDEEADRMKQWIEDAVQVSSSEAAELRPRKTPNSVRAIVVKAMEGLGPLLDGRQVEVEVDESLPNAFCDGEMMEKVIRQLLDNAIKYSPVGSPIRIAAEFTGAEIVIGVADSGCGIPKNEQKRIFEKYYRGRSTGSKVPGTGLGLPSVKCILEAHGGEIWVQSAPGEGSVFRISLPVTTEVPSERCEDFERR